MQSGSGLPPYHMIKNWNVARLCRGIARDCWPVWLCWLSSLRNADKARRCDPLSWEGSAHKRRSIKTYVKWTWGWLRSWYPLLCSSLEGGMGGRQGGSLPQGLQHNENRSRIRAAAVLTQQICCGLVSRWLDNYSRGARQHLGFCLFFIY